MGIHKNYMNKRHIVLFIATNMGIHRNCVFLLVTNFEIWVYKGMKIHSLLVTLKLFQIDFFEI